MLNRKSTYRSTRAASAAALILTLLLTGCTAANDRSNSGLNSPPPSSIDNTDNHVQVERADSPQQTYNQLPAVTDPALSLAAPDENGKAAGTGEAAKSQDNSLPAKEPLWDTEEPALAGVTIGESLAKVQEKLGKSLDQYELDSGELKVHEYKGYAIGFDRASKVKFIEVYDAKVATGLNGLRIGHKLDTAVKAIGKPSSQSSYVLSYEAKGALLKLDMDPQSKEVISIKLFVQD